MCGSHVRIVPGPLNLKPREMIQYKTGNLIELALAGEFDVIAHGCNCFCRMGAGLAPKMAAVFGCDKFPMENLNHSGDINKLGTIDYSFLYVKDGEDPLIEFPRDPLLKVADPQLLLGGWKKLIVVNCYTQYYPGKDLDYGALEMCMYKLRHKFKGLKFGLPKIGAGLAGGTWEYISEIINNQFQGEHVTVVEYNGVI